MRIVVLFRAIYFDLAYILTAVCLCVYTLRNSVADAAAALILYLVVLSLPYLLLLSSTYLLLRLPRVNPSKRTLFLF